LDLDEGSDFGAVANFASIEIDEVVDNNIAAELDVRSDYAELSEHEIAVRKVQAAFGKPA
jgi:hypothetical protein